MNCTIMQKFKNNAYFKNNNTLFIKLYNLTSRNLHGYFRELDHKNNLDLKLWMKTQLPLLEDKRYTYSTKCNWIFNDIHYFPTCRECGRIFDGNISINKSYPSFCGTCNRKFNQDQKDKKLETRNKHKAEDPNFQININIKVRQTKKDRYGSETFTNIEKAKNTRFKKHNGRWHANDFYEKVKRTKRMKYGDENFNNREKCKDTCLREYGCENVFQNEHIKEKIKETNIKTYGVENVFQSSKIQELCRLQHQKNYGVDNPFQSEEIKNKMMNTWMSNYGVDHPMKNGEVRKKAQHKYELICLEKYGSKSFLGSDEFKKRCLEEFGYENPMQNPDIRKMAASQYTYQSIKFDSGDELMYYIWLKDNNKTFEYQPRSSFSYEFNGKQHFYQPDFLVEKQFVEIKGDHFFKDDGTMCNPYDHSQDDIYEAKHQCMLKNNVIIIRSSECKQFRDHFRKKFSSLAALKKFKSH